MPKKTLTQPKQFLILYNTTIKSFGREVSFFFNGASMVSKKQLSPTQVSLINSDFSFENQNNFDPLSFFPFLAGVIVFRDRLIADALYPVLTKAKIPLLVYGSSTYAKDTGTPHFVSSHEEEIVRRALEFLWKKGHRKIGFLSNNGEVDFKRQAIWKEWMQARGQTTTPEMELVLSYKTIDQDLKDIHKVQKWLSSCTAIFSTSDFSLPKILTTLHHFGIVIPRDVSLLSVNNTMISEYSTPSITSINIPMFENGAQCMENLLRLCEGQQSHIREESKIELIERESVGSPRTKELVFEKEKS